MYLTLLKASLIFILLESVSANCGHGTSLHPREKDAAVLISNFSYSGTSGPLAWAGLSPANCACRLGKTQSPIVLNASTPFAASAPVLRIPTLKSAELENLGTTLEVPMSESGGTITFNKRVSQLKQFHFHTPSEHRVREEYFPLEMHMVHQSSVDGSITVLALLFQLSENGASTPLLASVTKNLANATQPGSSTTTGPLDFTAIARAVSSGRVYHYVGSLTTPPCAEGVTFLVLADPLPLDVRTYNALKRVLRFNARYTQNTLGKLNLLEVAYRIAETGNCAKKTP
ncbi:putative carbonic anhydrase [Mycena polygramma]|nr:putative carbonic anhydrase [Mycena polygramma]